MKICMEFSYFEVDMMKSKGLPDDFLYMTLSC